MRLPIILSAVFCANAALAEGPRVAVDIAPVHSLVAQVMDGVGAPDLIVRPGASPHNYAMRPSEAAALSDADMVIWMGDGLTPWLTGSIEKLAGDAIHLELLETDGTHLLEFREEIAFEHDDHEEHDKHDDHGDHEDHTDHKDHDGHGDHDDHADHDDHKEHDAHAADDDHDDHGGHDGHEHHGDHDPHAWLSPKNAQHWLTLIANELSAVDPDNADTYRNNAAQAVAELEQLLQSVEAVLDPVRGVPFMVFHDAYYYFEEAFDIHATAAVSIGDASRPGPARIAALRDLARDRQIGCVLTEPQFDPKLATSIMGDVFKTGELDPMGTSTAPGPALYADMMRALAAGFAQCAP